MSNFYRESAELMLKLPSELAINQVEELYRQVQIVAEVSGDITVDISDVLRTDTASIQLLCALQKHLNQSENKIVWHGESSAFLEAVEGLGLVEFLALNS